MTRGTNQRRTPAAKAIKTGTRDWGLGTGDWGLGTGDWGLETDDWRLATVLVPSPLAISKGIVSQPTCDLSPAPRPAQKLATVSARVLVAPSVIACTASAAARPLTSLSGLTAVNQYSGEVIATPTAASAQTFRAGSSLSSASRAPASHPSRGTACEFESFFAGVAGLLGACSHVSGTLRDPSSRRYSAAIARTPSVPATTLTRPRAVVSDETALCIAFAISMK